VGERVLSVSSGSGGDSRRCTDSQSGMGSSDRPGGGGYFFDVETMKKKTLGTSAMSPLLDLNQDLVRRAASHPTEVAFMGIADQERLAEVIRKRKEGLLEKQDGVAPGALHKNAKDQGGSPPTDLLNSNTPPDADTEDQSTPRPRPIAPSSAPISTENLPPPSSNADNSSETETTPLASSKYHPPLRVLVVDDDNLTRRLMTRMLTRLGCVVDTAENGQQALELLLGRPDTDAELNGDAAGPLPSHSGVGAAERYNVTFLDNQMHILSGLDMIGRLRELGRRDFVVGVTGNALLSDQEEYLDAGVDHVLTKPVLEQSLKAMLGIAYERRKQLEASQRRPSMRSFTQLQ